jgi:pyruvate/2-oxoglutarate dehydrogenase complex dihydrolipoamide dehydrogenase (E3) component
MNQRDTLKADVCVIGGGSGGLSVAAGASQMGARVVLVEKAEMGGDCLNTGCVPSKSLLALAKAVSAPAKLDTFGLSPQSVPVDRKLVRRYVDSVIAGIAPHDSVERFESLGVTVIQASARFIGPRAVEAGGQVIKARRFVIATGSSPLVPPIPGLDQVPYFTNETIFANEDELPHLLVIGGGPIGLELAQANRRLGSDVTVIEMARILPRDDAEAAAVVRQKLIAEGIALHEEAPVTAVRREGPGIVVEIGAGGSKREIAGTHLLLAVGRRPNTAGLDLETAGVAYTPAGISVDARLRSSNRRVYAIGDIAGGPQFTHVAGHHAGVVIRNILFRLPAKSGHDGAPWVTFTDPELAHVGLDEESARASGREIEVLRWPFAENDRARTESQTEGFVKAITDKKGRILGATIVGAHAGELIQTWVLAIAQGMKVSKLAGMITPYPTFAEANQRAAGSYFTPRLFNDRVRRIVRFLSWFG